MPGVGLRASRDRSGRLRVTGHQGGAISGRTLGAESLNPSFKLGAANPYKPLAGAELLQLPVRNPCLNKTTSAANLPGRFIQGKKGRANAGYERSGCVLHFPVCLHAERQITHFGRQIQHKFVTCSGLSFWFSESAEASRKPKWHKADHRKKFCNRARSALDTRCQTQPHCWHRPAALPATIVQRHRVGAACGNA